MIAIRKYLQYLWLRGIYQRRIIDYIGATEGSRHYQYIREACGREYAQMCSSMPPSLKRRGFDVAFRNLIISPIYYEKVYGILKSGKDSTMSQRVNETMKGSIGYLLRKTAWVWIVKWCRDGISEIVFFLRSIKWHNKGVPLEVIEKMAKELDFNCVMMSSKFVKVFSLFHSEIYKNICQSGAKPLFIFFGKRFSCEKKDNGYMVEIPFQAAIMPQYSLADQLLLNDAARWVSELNVSRTIRREIISEVRRNFPQYLYLQEIASKIVRANKARCLLTFSENQIDYRIFLYEAKKNNLPTILFYHVDGVHLLIYDAYYSDVVLVANKIQYRNFLNIGYSPEQCHMVGSFSFSPPDLQRTGKLLWNKEETLKILYFTKGTKNIDEGILDELIEKLKSLNIDYHITIKKHPKNIHAFKRFQNDKSLITGDLDYMKFVNASDIIVSQYSGVVRRIIPLKRPIILYTYNDILEYGERAFFGNIKLPNYFKYVQNKREFHQAIEQLLDLTEPEPLPQKLAEDLYGHLDNNCGSRIADVVNSYMV